MSSKNPIPDARLEAIAQAASRVYEKDGGPMATQYIYNALEAEGLYCMGNPKKSKIKGWECFAIGDRARHLCEERRAAK